MTVDELLTWWGDLSRRKAKLTEVLARAGVPLALGLIMPLLYVYRHGVVAAKVCRADLWSTNLPYCRERLRDMGLLEEVICPDDRRVRLYRLTPAGEELARRIEACLQEFQE